MSLRLNTSILYSRILIFVVNIPRSIPDYWKIVLESFISISEKKLASSGTVLFFCDYFELIKKQKRKSYQKVLNLESCGEGCKFWLKNVIILLGVEVFRKS